MTARIDTDLARAIALLKEGAAVAIPTETVYGLAADAMNPAAVRRVFALKGRPATHPVIVHIADATAIDAWAQRVPDAARVLAAAFWPGPLTLILPRRPEVPDSVTGGQDSVGLRVPDHPLSLALLEQSGLGLAAPSANRFGRVSPTTAEHVASELGDAVDMILDGGPCRVGVESTIVDFTGPTPVLRRPGDLSPEAIAAALGQPIAFAPGSGPRAPGTLAAHYAPRTPLCLAGRDTLWRRIEQLSREGVRVAALALAPVTTNQPNVSVMPAEAEAYARLLYARLREIDAADYDILLVETVPDTPAWLAVRDRLRRAAAHCPPA